MAHFGGLRPLGHFGGLRPLGGLRPTLPLAALGPIYFLILTFDFGLSFSPRCARPNLTFVNFHFLGTLRGHAQPLLTFDFGLATFGLWATSAAFGLHQAAQSMVSHSVIMRCLVFNLFEKYTPWGEARVEK